MIKKSNHKLKQFLSLFIIKGGFKSEETEKKILYETYANQIEK